MSFYKIVKDSIKRNKQIKEAGGHIGIPVPFKKLADYVPIIERGHSIGILGATGSGKSRFTRWFFIYHIYKFYKETGYPVRIIYFPLEDSKEKVYRNLICHYMHENYNIYVSLAELDSKGDKALPKFVEDKLDEAEAFFDDFEKVITLIDGLNEPTQLYKYCENYAMATGKVENYIVTMEGQQVKQSRYIADDEVHTIVVVDNMSNVDIEDGVADERRAIVKFCKEYARARLCNFFKFTVVQVLQQDFASERQNFTRDGSTIVSKLEPSLAGVGDSKTITRDMHLVLGLFNPSRFQLIQYPIPSKMDPLNTYRLDILGNRFRSLSILKANDGDFGLKLAFNFDAVSEVMTELPLPKTPEIEAIYQRIRERNPDKFAKVKNVVIQEDEELEAAPF